jgi:hypothetical protein
MATGACQIGAPEAQRTTFPDGIDLFVISGELARPRVLIVHRSGWQGTRLQQRFLARLSGASVVNLNQPWLD